MTTSVLIVDDCSSMRTAVKTVLQRLKLEVVEADDGQAALAALDQHKIDLIITDVHMDVMDGISMAAAARNKPGYQSVPICMLTIDSSPETIAAGKAAGASAWLRKPFKPQSLHEAVEKLVH